MKVFLVGGAVRDKLLGITPNDCDYLVLNSSAKEMSDKGFVRVGASYQVFLHPSTKEEYVLADDLMADLARRDLTINSMAMDELKGEIIDPFMGREDLRNKILRHTSEHFSDDPLRVYRVARFKAQFPDFQIAEETLQLMTTIAGSQEFKNLHSNRIFNELKTALQTKKPSSFFDTLKQVEALFPEIKRWDQLEKLRSDDPLLRFASLVQNLSMKEVTNLCETLAAPNDWKEAGITASLVYPHVDHLKELAAEDLVELLYKMDAFRKSYLLNFLHNLYGEKLKLLTDIFFHIKKVSLEENSLTGKQIGERIKQERVVRAHSFLESERRAPLR